MPKNFDSFSPVKIEMPSFVTEKDVSTIDLPSGIKEEIETMVFEKKPMVILGLEDEKVIELLRILAKRLGKEIEIVSSEDFADRTNQILGNMSERKIVVVGGIDNFDDEALLPCFRLVRAKNEMSGSEKQMAVVFIGSVGASANFNTINHPLLNLSSFINKPTRRNFKPKI